MDKNLTEAENIKALVDLGIDKVKAKFIYDIETGAQDGDAINKDGVDEFRGVLLNGNFANNWRGN